MSQIVLKSKMHLGDAVKNAITSAIKAGELTDASIPGFIFETPADRSHGDLACNVAMASAKTFKTSPVKIAQAIKAHLNLTGTYFTGCEIAGPGFLNFFYDRRFYSDILKDVMSAGEAYGRSTYGNHEKTMVEFISANPTGPMHMGNARGGALGDCLASVLDAAGYDVWREFYVNDAGNQLEKFGLSLDIRYRQIFEKTNAPQLPEDSYHGDDITEIAKEYAGLYGDTLLALDESERRKTLIEYGLPKNIEKMQADMKRYRITYDKWFYESELHQSGEVKEVVDILTEKGLTYELDGALWYKATNFGAEKDEVLLRANGNPTYFTADIAYHRNKFKRGYSWLIDIWGADHHGHVARMKAAMQAIGENADKLDIVLMQLVSLLRDGEAVRMSKRTGKAVNLGDLLDEVPADAARFTFNLHEPNIRMDFDLGLAVKEDSQNPVYYVQYAHARICSILKNLRSDGISPRACTDEELALLTAPEEVELIKAISQYTDEIISAAKNLDPSRITRYVISVATLFHKFYNACRVKGEAEGLMQARLCLCTAAQTVIKNVLTLFKVSVPDTM